MLNTAKTIMGNEMQATDIRQDIFARIETLSLDSLQLLQKIVMLLQQHIRPTIEESEVDSEPKRMKIVTIPASQVLKLAGALPTGYEGDALVDTETYYDDI